MQNPHVSLARDKLRDHSSASDRGATIRATEEEPVNKKRRIRVGLLFGGRSPEHEISITTAASIAKEADPERLEIVPIWLTREGRWLELKRGEMLAALAGRLLGERELGEMPRREVLLSAAATTLVPTGRSVEDAVSEPIDVLFPALHGQGGEDGSVQGLARLAGLPCVGAGILGSALGMDKISMKRIAATHGLPVVPFVEFTRADWARAADEIRDEIMEKLPFPVFIKPSGAGSSVGITKVVERDGLSGAVLDAARYDYRMLAEQGIDARELEVAVLGNDEPQASVVGEVVPGRDFYDYRDKYLQEGSRVVIPAEVPREVTDAVRGMAIRAFRALDLSGMARVDFLLDRGNANVYFNEVNTIPGFTPISMYPMLWQASGISYRDLITRLVDLAIERHGSTRVETRAPQT
jgi:D-alanine-D-alanine ligase